MPAKSELQRKFFILVKATQDGKVSPKRVGSKVAKAAKSMSRQDVDDFTKGKNLPKEKLEEIIDGLNDLRYDTTGASMEPMYLDEDETTDSNQNPIAKTFKQEGKDLQQHVDSFFGLELKPKELEAVYNYDKSKPSNQITPNVKTLFLKYESTNDAGESLVTIIKKLRNGTDLVFTAFQTQSVPESSDDKESTDKGDTIIISNSKPFRTEIEGGNILLKMLEKLEV
jgi:hypothetical protein